MGRARFSLSRHILADIQRGYHILLIVDECYHCVGEIKAKFFDFFPLRPYCRGRGCQTARAVAGDIIISEGALERK